MSLIKIGLCLLSTFFIIVGFIANAITSKEDEAKEKIIVYGLYSAGVLSLIVVLILEA